MNDLLLNRHQFRTGVFARDSQECVFCQQPGQDAHHIIERRLWPDGGYYLDNGVTLCGACHLKAESTELGAGALRIAAGIGRIVLPPHLYPDESYDKWGNVILNNGRRLQGELYDDPSVQKVLAPVLHLFDHRVKYPRTWHLPWSPAVGVDDRVLSGVDVDLWGAREVVVTEKMDGENTSMYHDYLHARSVDYSSHPSRSYVRQLHAQICGDIPDGWRICGENLWAKHSIKYDTLKAYFQVFSIWNGTVCLSWDDTTEWCDLLGLTHVPVLYRGPWAELVRNGTTPMYWYLMFQAGALATEPKRTIEGYVVRPAKSFRLHAFTTDVGKFVRKDHVTTHGHWMRSVIEQNGLARTP